MKKKLIEVSLPLEAINAASAREKSIRHGHPSTLHLWWARRPLAACRAVLFASLVDDPASLPEQFPTEEDQQRERRRLHDIIEELVLWENSNNERVLNAARAEIMRSTNNNPPPVYDPFAGGGSIPLEAQRLGLEAHASDLNPVAVLINKALIEIPPKFAGQPPVNPVSRAKLDHTKSWRGAQGLAADVRYYGHWMRAEARQRIGHLYPQVAAVQQQDGSFRHATPEESTAVSTGSGSARVTPKLRHLTVIAWLWARTVKCPNPTCGAMMPLVSSFALSTKAAKRAWVEPQIDPIAKTIKFEVRTGKGEVPSPPKLGRGAKFRCLVCGIQASENDIRGEFKAKRNGQQLMAIVAEGERGRIYLSPTKEQEEIAYQAMPKWKPTEEMNTETPNLVSGRGYGITHWHEIFTNRQLVALTTFSDLVGEAREKILEDARKISTENAESYAEAVATYLGIGGSKLSDYNSSFAVWSPGRDQAKATFARQALPMVWDFVEVNPFAKAAGDIEVTLKGSQETLERSIVSEAGNSVRQLNATEINSSVSLLISTDPPYYNSIGYADLSDFFYIWLRRSLSTIYPDICGTLLVPKAPELVATPHRFDGNRRRAKEFFEEGLSHAFRQMRAVQHPTFPLTVYYAFKQAEEDDSGINHNQTVTASTGWETILEALINAGFSITGTWPMRTERAARTISIGTNALASSIVLVCRPRPDDAAKATRGEFLRALKRELPGALRYLQVSNIAPVDLAQAAIGPGMAVYSRYAQVVESDGSPMRVRTALGIINQILDETLAEQDSEYDSDTRWAIEWFAQYGMNSGPFGDADVLARAKNTSVAGLVEAGALHSRAGKVRLLRRDELPADWHPDTDPRLTIWEITQHLIRLVETQGEQAAARIFQSENIGYRGDIARDLAYRLYNFCERKGWASEALAYNALVVAWHDIQQQADELARTQAAEQSSFEFD